MPSVVEKNSLNPFTPGAGGLPPYLAGREPEQRVLRRLFDRMHAGAPTNRLLIFYGPRGNGKTALLKWTLEQVEGDDGLDGTWLTPADIPVPEKVAERLHPKSWADRIAPENISVVGVSVGLRSSGEEPLLAAALEARAKVRPFVVFLDEAHTISAEVGHLLLNAAQTAGRRSPFLLVLAGTPDLRDRLRGIGASFWSRGDIRPLGRLDAEAAADAIREPLAGADVEIEPEALDRIVRESHGYPFFVQIWGRVVWERANPSSDAGRCVTATVVEEAAPEFHAIRNRFYEDRFDELEERKLVAPAREVALAFRGRKQLTGTEFREAVRRGTAPGDGPDETAAVRVLKHLGLVWKSDGAPTWEPGIPSLMDYILEYAPAPTA